MKFDINKLNWTREPEDYTISQDKIEIITKPHTDGCKWLAHDGQQPDEYIRFISNSVRFGCGYRIESGRKQYFAFHGSPNRNDDYYITTEISEEEYEQICRDYPEQINANSITAALFKNKYIDGHSVILEGWNELLR